MAPLVFFVCSLHWTLHPEQSILAFAFVVCFVPLSRALLGIGPAHRLGHPTTKPAIISRPANITVLSAESMGTAPRGNGGQGETHQILPVNGTRIWAWVPVASPSVPCKKLSQESSPPTCRETCGHGQRNQRRLWVHTNKTMRNAQCAEELMKLALNSGHHFVGMSLGAMTNPTKLRTAKKEKRALASSHFTQMQRSTRGYPPAR